MSPITAISSLNPVTDRPVLRWTLYSAVAVALALATIYYYRHDPADSGGLFPPCVFHQLTRLYCPGCGSQRAAHQLLHGRALGALHCNPLLCLAIPILAWEALAKATGRLPSLLDHPCVGRTIVWVVVLFAIFRNIPVWPCTLLAPGS
ncbi:MAG: DUF2752 domain-containing protein [Tepidisphaeraceae bacterium]|jgi:hypothetical protein